MRSVPVLPMGDVEPGTTILVAGDPLTGKDDIVQSLIENGYEDGEGVLYITTKNAAEHIDQAVDIDTESEGFEILECLSDPLASGAGPTSGTLSPGDMTSVAMAFSNQFGRLEQADASPVRVVLHSVSPMLKYTDEDSLYRFLHVLVTRIQRTGGLGVVTIDEPGDADIVRRLSELFTGLVELRMSDDGRELRPTGFPGVDRTWTAWKGLRSVSSPTQG